jgi:hypothetical protein
MISYKKIGYLLDIFCWKNLLHMPHTWHLFYNTNLRGCLQYDDKWSFVLSWYSVFCNLLHSNLLYTAWLLYYMILHRKTAATTKSNTAIIWILRKRKVNNDTNVFRFLSNLYFIGASTELFFLVLTYSLDIWCTIDQCKQEFKMSWPN